MHERYERNQPALSREEQARLRAARICIVGCGGLGGYLTEYMARLGVGGFTLVDGDVFSTSNLNRQLLCTMDTLGRSKAEVAAERVRAIDPEIAVRTYREPFTEENSAKILAGCCLALDGLDSAAARLTLAKCCETTGIPLIHGAIQGWSMQAAACMPGNGFMNAIYPQAAAPEEPICSLAFTPALCAAIQAAEALKLLLGREASLQDGLLFGDLQSIEFMKLHRT